MKKIKSSVLAVAALSVLSTACVDVKSEKKKSNRITNSADANEIIGDENIELQVISKSAFKMAAVNKSLLTISNSKVMQILKDLPQGSGAAESINKSKSDLNSQEETLYIGFPIGLVGEQNVFGGVITQVSDTQNESLGTLKLTDLTPIHVRTVINSLPDGTPVMTLVGCFSNCTESSAQSALLNLPIVGYNQDSGMLILDMSIIGKELDLVSMMDPQGQYTKLKAISSGTTSVEYDMKTLIFDIKTTMIPVTASSSDASAPRTEFSVRWYLKLNSDQNPAFEAREATQGVGFFQTDRGSKSKITRFSTTEMAPGIAPVKYYIKNVPDEFKGVFAKALEDWNVEFRSTIGHNLISYEFVDATDPRADLLVPGDIRYNIIEWDLVNKAGYGGLGPSIANQYTGQTMSANVLVQGPTIVTLYKKWFGISEKARELKEMGKLAEANKLVKEFNAQVQKELAPRTSTQYKLKLGKHLDMNIHAQKAELMDPIAKGEFEIVPANMTYEEYMDGYMLEIVAHEIGHNLGLRHNFKGNLGAYENGEEGSVSRSVMEYLGRPYRHLNTIGPYDRMAIAYGYTGSMPKHLDWFCTDEDQAQVGDLVSLKTKSPECTNSDATSDPFSYWEGRIDRVLDLVLERKSDAAPVWTVPEVNTQLTDAVTRLLAYGLSAENTADTWTNFFGKNDRPEDKKQVKEYVLYRLEKKLCNPKLDQVLARKESAEARALAEENLKKVIDVVAATTTVYVQKAISCEK